MRIFGVN
jgi:mRNA interferase RelE/StbE